MVGTVAALLLVLVLVVVLVVVVAVPVVITLLIGLVDVVDDAVFVFVAPCLFERRTCERFRLGGCNG